MSQQSHIRRTAVRIRSVESAPNVPRGVSAHAAPRRAVPNTNTHLSSFLGGCVPSWTRVVNLLVWDGLIGVRRNLNTTQKYWTSYPQLTLTTLASSLPWFIPHIKLATVLRYSCFLQVSFKYIRSHFSQVPKYCSCCRVSLLTNITWTFV